MRAAIGTACTINRLRWSGKGVTPKNFLLYQPEPDPAKRLAIMKAQAEAFAIDTQARFKPKS